MQHSSPPGRQQHHWIFLSTCLGLLFLIAGGSWFIHRHRLPPRAASPVAPKLLATYVHRAGVGPYPENSLAAIRHTAAQGAQGIEFDVHSTKDGVLVTTHDPRLERCTTGKGRVCHHTWAELQQLRLLYQGQPTTARIPTLVQVLDLCKELGLLMDIELKNTPYPQTVIQQLVQHLRQRKLYDKAIVTSFYPQLLHQLRKCDRRVTTGLLLGAPPFTEVPSRKIRTFLYLLPNRFYHHWLPHYLQVDMVCPQQRLLSPKRLQQWQKSGLEVLPWTVNSGPDKQHVRAFHLGYITDCPKGVC